MKISKITNEEVSTLWGMNGGCPESPDGKRIVYAAKKSLDDSETRIMISNYDFTEYQEVFRVSCGNHNGPSATFTDNSHIVFRDSEEGLSVFRILDINSGEVLHKIFAKESHCAENMLYPFSVSREFMGKNPSYPQIKECGIYILNLWTGDIQCVATENDIENMIREHGLTPRENSAAVSHVQLSPNGTALMMRIGVPECPVFGALGCIDLKTHKTHMIPDKPVHQLWFDDETYMATRQFDRGGIIEMETSYLARFTKDGEELEILGGIGNHMDGSRDRKYFTGDRCYPGFAPNVYIYRRGDKQPIAEFEIPDMQEIIWKKQVHPNPTFSHVGKRLYFNRPNQAGGTDAVFADISEYME